MIAPTDSHTSVGLTMMKWGLWVTIVVVPKTVMSARLIHCSTPMRRPVSRIHKVCEMPKAMPNAVAQKMLLVIQNSETNRIVDRRSRKIGFTALRKCIGATLLLEPKAAPCRSVRRSECHAAMYR